MIACVSRLSSAKENADRFAYDHFRNPADLAPLTALYACSKCFYSLFLLRSSRSSVFGQLEGSSFGMSTIEYLVDFLKRQLAVRTDPLHTESTHLLGLDDKEIDYHHTHHIPGEKDEVIWNQLRLYRWCIGDPLMYPISLKAIGIPKVLIKEAALVHQPCNAKPFARFSYASTSAGYRPCSGVHPNEKNTMNRTIIQYQPCDVGRTYR